MRNPLENEEAAFRFVLGTIAYLAPIVLASWIATWLGIVVFVLATAVAVLVLRSGAKPTAPRDAGRAAVEDTWRVLVLANETLEGSRLREVIVRIVDGVAEDVLVVCPVFAPPFPTGSPDQVSARTMAEARLQSALADLRAAGVNARGEIGDGDPLVALEDALRSFPADEIVISTHAEGHSPWLEQGVLDAAGARFDGPITHVSGDARPPQSP